jgi:hypothetical protein
MRAGVMRRSEFRCDDHRIGELEKHLPTDDPCLRAAGCGPHSPSRSAQPMLEAEG